MINNAECYKKGYPRPRFVRDSFVLLDGNWKFAFGKNKYDNQNKITFNKDIIVPYSYNSESSGINDQNDHEVVWYKKEFIYNLKKRRRFWLNFDGVDYFAKVYLNGKYIGCHEGGYSRFSFEISDLIKEKNILIVQCVDPFDPAYPRGKQRHLDHNTGCFYKPSIGIWKSVWIEETGSNRIIDVYAEINYEKCIALLNYQVEDFEKGLEFNVSLKYKGQYLGTFNSEVMAKEGIISIDLQNRSEQLPMKPWSAGACSQYFDIIYTLKKNNIVIDKVGSYIGLVDYSTSKNRIMINYLPNTYFRMVLDQGYYKGGDLTGTEEQIIEDILLIKEMGFNGVRVHQKIEDERFYYYCDMIGLYVWCEMPSAYVTDERTISSLLLQWQEIVHQTRGYISLMAYVPFNEDWGCLQISKNKRQQAFVTACYWITKALAHSQLVVGNDGWEQTETDILTLHNYTSSGESLYESYCDMDQFIEGKRVNDLYTRSAFSEGFEYKGQPIIISEFGGVKFSGNTEGWGYGNCVKNDEEYFNRLYDLVLNIKKNKQISGYCLTQFTDVFQETNGIVTYERKPKIDINKIKEINLI